MIFRCWYIRRFLPLACLFLFSNLYGVCAFFRNFSTLFLFGVFFFQMSFHPFSIRFSQSSHGSASSSSLPTELDTHTINSRTHMSDCCQFNLEPGFHAGGVFIEDLQYEIYSISDIDTKGA